MLNIYFAAVVAHWRSISAVPGFPLCYRLGRKLVGDRTTKGCLEHLDGTESQFADDAALYITSHDNLCTMANEFISCTFDSGLTVSITKTKAMSAGPGRVCADLPVLCGDNVISCQDEFTYLGSNIRGDGQLDHEIASRLAKALRAFGRQRTPSSATRHCLLGHGAMCTKLAS